MHIIGGRRRCCSQRCCRRCCQPCAQGLPMSKVWFSWYFFQLHSLYCILFIFFSRSQSRKKYHECHNRRVPSSKSLMLQGFQHQRRYGFLLWKYHTLWFFHRCSWQNTMDLRAYSPLCSSLRVTLALKNTIPAAQKTILMAKCHAKNHTL